jgi:hypothetical protein
MGPDAEAALEEAGRRTGLICAGCGGSLDQSGWEYLTLRPEVQEAAPKIVISKAYVCNRQRCAHVRARLEQSATARRPWQPWHIFEDAPPPSNGAGDAEAQAGPDAEQETFWNGEPCPAERCVVIVGKVDSDHWAHPFIGTERNAVMVKVGDETLYIDDEGFEMSDEAIALAKSRGRPMERKVGSPGWGWSKVTQGRGLPGVGHANLPVERIVSTAHDESV